MRKAGIEAQMAPYTYILIYRHAWVMSIRTAGYLFGRALEVLLDNIRRYELEAVLGIMIAGTAIWIARLLRKRKKKKLIGA
jgi:membrane protein DedA with SNARE-associated domain